MTALFLSDKSLAARWGVSRNTVWRWARARKIPQPIKISGSTRWNLEGIERFEAEKEGRAQ